MQILEWQKSPGEAVAVDDVLAVIETDKVPHHQLNTSSTFHDPPTVDSTTVHSVPPFEHHPNSYTSRPTA